MRDLLPEEAAGFDALAAVVQARALRYGYARIVTPVVEEKRVFIKTSGESSDIVSKEMFEVRLGGEGDLVLRPEATPAIARAFLNAGLHKATRPQRFYAYEPMFRGQRPQKLRFRQFWQWDIECFGAEEAAVDVEIKVFDVQGGRELSATSKSGESSSSANIVFDASNSESVDFTASRASRISSIELTNKASAPSSPSPTGSQANQPRATAEMLIARLEPTSRPIDASRHFAGFV